jgi:hypothetical protein
MTNHAYMQVFVNVSNSAVSSSFKKIFIDLSAEVKNDFEGKGGSTSKSFLTGHFHISLMGASSRLWRIHIYIYIYILYIYIYIYIIYIYL